VKKCGVVNSRIEGGTIGIHSTRVKCSALQGRWKYTSGESGLNQIGLRRSTINFAESMGAMASNVVDLECQVAADLVLDTDVVGLTCRYLQVWIDNDRLIIGTVGNCRRRGQTSWISNVGDRRVAARGNIGIEGEVIELGLEWWVRFGISEEIIEDAIVEDTEAATNCGLPITMKVISEADTWFNQLPAVCIKLTTGAGTNRSKLK